MMKHFVSAFWATFFLSMLGAGFVGKVVYQAAQDDPGGVLQSFSFLFVTCWGFLTGVFMSAWAGFHLPDFWPFKRQSN